ncbi:MAG: 30S ribosomal protein S9 [Elusimicrobia bacterium]|nr:30S ribosomal protein S9 [Elusimicrobiota bacterium]
MPENISVGNSKTIIAIGRRKTAVARVKLSAGSGKLVVNKKPVDKYFAGLPRFQMTVIEPLKITNLLSQYDVSAVVGGGGVMAQSEAIRHGIARAIASIDAGFKATMKKEGFLTRDDRMVERKKPGRAKARKSFQWTKR